MFLAGYAFGHPVLSGIAVLDETGEFQYMDVNDTYKFNLWEPSMSFYHTME